MQATTHHLHFDGGILQRGFWLYVWEISPPSAEPLYYVGRTGDSSSPFAQSPFNRMGQHLGFNKNSNVLRKRLKDLGIHPEECRFQLVSHGPILEEAGHPTEHLARRDQVAAMEKALAEALNSAGYAVINKVHCRHTLDRVAFEPVLSAFSGVFPRISGLFVANSISFGDKYRPVFVAKPA